MSEFLTPLRRSIFLAALTIGVAACGTDAGNGFAATDSKCVDYKATIDLKEGDGIHIEPNSLQYQANGNSRNELFRNIGGHLVITDLGTDKIDVERAGTVETETDRMTIKTDEVGTSFSYRQDGKSFTVNVQELVHKIVQLEVEQTCHE